MIVYAMTWCNTWKVETYVGMYPDNLYLIKDKR